MEPHCCICGTAEDLSFCDICKKYFCKPCKVNYPARVLAMFTEAYKRLASGQAEKA